MANEIENCGFGFRGTKCIFDTELNDFKRFLQYQTH